MRTVRNVVSSAIWLAVAVVLVASVSTETFGIVAGGLIVGFLIRNP